jgi:endonuclease/exonuclease/phosphatase family metal-dependent hydrolase
MLPCPLRKIFALVLLFCAATSLPAADTFRIATYNVENYLLESSGTRPAKPATAKAKVCEGILALKPDVLALQEIGGTNALFELQSSLKTNGLDLPNWELITGFDTNIHVAILSRFPITARRPHTNDFFLMAGQRFRVSRGFAEVEINVNDHYSFTLITAHLKSRRPIPEADEADLRLEEAQVLRHIIDGILTTNPDVNLVVLGDLNDLHSSKPVKTIIGSRGKKALVDTRPAERNGDTPPSSDRRLSSRNVAWTHYYNVDDDYSRIDYILLSKALSRQLLRRR